MECDNQIKEFATVPNYEGSRFKREYLREDREPVTESKEDADASERAIGDGSEGIVTPEMRTLFFNHEGYMGSDAEVMKWYTGGIIASSILAKKPTTFVGTNPAETVSKSEEKQVGGDHYKNMVITPTDYVVANEIAWCEANVIKYISRHRAKNGREDVEKAKHYCELLLKQYDTDERLESLIT